jgi:hypothetical protein
MAGGVEVKQGAKVFQTITSWVTNIDPGAGATLDLSTSTGIGLGGAVTSIDTVCHVGGVDEAVVGSTPASGVYHPTTAPDGLALHGVRYKP